MRLRELLNKWLEIDIVNVSHKLGFSSEKTTNIDAKIIIDTLQKINMYSLRNNEKDYNIIITVLGIMWEHIDTKQYDLRELYLKILTRIGYSVNSVTIDDIDKKSGKFIPINSIIDKIYLTMQMEKYEVKVGEEIYLLTSFQKKTWDLLMQDGNIGISAPTSAGKSFIVLLNLAYNIIEKEIDIIYLVPTLSLLYQIKQDLNYILRKFGAKDYIILDSYEDTLNNYRNCVYIMTQEKAQSLIANTKINRNTILVVDEIQNIELLEDENDIRSKILYDTIIEFSQFKDIEKIILLGPNISNYADLGKYICRKNIVEQKTNISPVVNLVYSIGKYKNKYVLNQYSTLTNESLKIDIENDSLIQEYGKKQYNDAYINYLNTLLNKFKDEIQNIVFSPTVKTAINIAMKLNGKKNDELRELIEYYKTTVSEEYSLCKCLEKGIAFHHGKLPTHVRKTLEYAIINNKIKTVVCTTTLIQGINLPVKNIFIRNPHLYQRKTANSRDLTKYEFMNLSGRAGRLMGSLVGRVFVLDEDEFLNTDEYKDYPLFSNVSKELPTNYGNKFNINKDKILDALNKSELINSSNKEYGYLLSYIRQTILKYDVDAIEKLNNVGIEISNQEFLNIQKKLDVLCLDKEYYIKNKYWDPLLLDIIYKKFNGDIPRNPLDTGAEIKYKKILEFIISLNQYDVIIYDKKVLEVISEIGVNIIAKICFMWMHEKSLKTIVKYTKNNVKKYGKNVEIEDVVDLLNVVISYKIPLILEPIFLLDTENNSFLLSLRLGAINACTREMINMGIPRETAIYLNTKYFKMEVEKFKNIDRIIVQKNIKNRLQIEYDNLPFWIQIQLDNCI